MDYYKRKTFDLIDIIFIKSLQKNFLITQGSQHSGKTWKIMQKLEKFKKSGKTHGILF